VEEPAFSVRCERIQTARLARILIDFARNLWHNRPAGVLVTGVSMSCLGAFPKVAFSALLLLGFASAQMNRSDQVQIAPPLLRGVDPPPPTASAAELESQADALHAQKLYLDALDYYAAALKKMPKSAPILNKVCRTEIMMQRWKEAQKSCQQAVHADPGFATAYGNLGVTYYCQHKFANAVKNYVKAISLDATTASFFSNLGAAYFAQHKFDPAVAAYQHAMELDPDVFMRSSRSGITAQLPSPEDRARYDYTVARLYAKMGLSDKSLEYLRKAREEGFKDLNNVYKDAEFADLRKDPRFVELMAAKTPTLSD
jgi:tetratricopeptide (TPR) repeat protein